MLTHACRVLDDVVCYCPTEYDGRFKEASEFWCENFCCNSYRQCWYRYLEWRSREDADAARS